MDQRRSFRFPEHLAQRESVVTIGKTNVPALLVDLSEEGAGVIIDESPTFAPGDYVHFRELERPNAPRWARVTHLFTEDDGFLRVGLEWV